MILKPETIAMIQVYEWVKQNTNLPFMHIANEGKRSIANTRILKRMGMRPGVSDIFIPRACRGYHGLWIELKVGSNEPTAQQIDFLEQMISEGYLAKVIYEAEPCIEYIANFYSIEHLGLH